VARISTAEIAALARFSERLSASGVRGVLAHLVTVDGSHYRRPGARMVFGEDGSSSGSLSGGCLEAGLALECAAVLAEGRPRLVEYDLRGNDDVVWGTGLGCAGRVEILLSPLPETRILEALANAEDGATLATVLDAGDFDRGEQSLLSAGKPVAGSGRLAAALSAGEPLRQRVLLEAIEPPVRLLAAGTGRDVLALVSASQALGWDVRVFSPRPSRGARERVSGFPLHSAAEIAAHAGPRAAAVVATHNYLDDLEILRNLLPTNAPYIGLLGARSRVVRLTEDCRDVLAGDGDPRIFGPAGLDIGADTPEEIALSIAAEIQAVLQGRPGRSLRDRSQPIHDRATGELSPGDDRGGVSVRVSCTG
jgi:xanthine/CO dehydrogenase XdhC/CoxF family maturation factor